MDRICLSNQGGCQTVEVKVVTQYLGSNNDATHTFRSRTGEWGGLNFPMTSNVILVHASDGKATWAPLVSRDGKTYFKAASMSSVGVVPVWKLEKDADGNVPLETLVGRIRAGK
ncbi:hypothetical protein D3872_05205 [Massilia cavernae]|uniref:Uncharacterized protein n=2 Tax=Massilia cavernae TaxID=2320864 RepID=A0A418Y5X6_9BURK|nr:hypothetical protein D3872_05205 [Massilia cavernae]